MSMVAQDHVPRIPNQDGLIRCRACRNDGMVVFNRRKPMPTLSASGDPIAPSTTETFEELAPCPYCVAGLLVEFPLPDDKGRQRVGHWGADGFWRGKESYEPNEETDERPLSLAENRRRLAELKSSLGLLTKPVEA